MLYTVGVNIAFLLALLLLSKKGKSQADKILACWLFVIGLHLMLFYLHTTALAFRYPVSIGLHLPLPLVHGPFLFLYTASVTRQHTLNWRKLLFHFSPAIACFLYLIP